MLKDYTPLMRQAEELENNGSDIYYSEALTILNNNKPHRISALMSDLNNLINLLVIELNTTGGIQDVDLAMGSLIGLDSLVNKRELLLNAVRHSQARQVIVETPDVVLNREADRVRESYKKYFNYNCK